ncbi:hypothetical protein NPIL_273621 [Nephila pilipes]|uniref:Uncharacterized protein n=1 Tax=Nephila pilipes TaxID=299642 RepID=A0A8X6UIN6_NEPPI|nr:hypothetical protein NPIL_273621 [Nephila pilipes]
MVFSEAPGRRKNREQALPRGLTEEGGGRLSVSTFTESLFSQIAVAGIRMTRLGQEGKEELLCRLFWMPQESSDGTNPARSSIGPTLSRRLPIFNTSNASSDIPWVGKHPLRTTSTGWEKRTPSARKQNSFSRRFAALLQRKIKTAIVFNISDYTPSSQTGKLKWDDITIHFDETQNQTLNILARNLTRTAELSSGSSAVEAITMYWLASFRVEPTARAPGYALNAILHIPLQRKRRGALLC